MFPVELILCIVIASLSIIPLILFTIEGYPGSPEDCLSIGPSACLCENFSITQFNNPGILQPVNTFTNIIYITVALIISFLIFSRTKSEERKRIQRGWTTVDFRLNEMYGYVFVGSIVLVFGCSSMYHSSMTYWAGVLDSAGVFVTFQLVMFYTVARVFNNEIIMIGFPFLLVGSTVYRYVTGHSLVPFVITLGGEVVFEVVYVVISKKRKNVRLNPYILLASFLVLIVSGIAWALSQGEGDILCFPDSWFIVHGWIWHIGTGISVLLYYLYLDSIVPITVRDSEF
eukprot:TRINITY_DN5180_c0_g1_i1.p1 TRINITY_DN5180_c0_g1~~TRINITY_DN5180_c0_g1_i1.p1  ORF type:complete len:309 (-),score=44.83 TRINITY_DN5180_c0_g1_i1:56-913(-)